MFSYVYVFAFNGSTEGARYSIHFENLRISKSIGCGNFATNLPVVLDTTSLCESSNWNKRTVWLGSKQKKW